MADLTALQRLRLLGELRKQRIEAEGSGAGPAAALKKLKIAKAIRDIRQQLGLGTAKPADPPPAPPEEDANVASLRKIAAGEYDGDGLDGLQKLYGRISLAVNGLNDGGLLVGDAEGAANSAITHWAELEERING